MVSSSSRLYLPSVKHTLHAEFCTGLTVTGIYLPAAQKQQALCLCTHLCVRPFQAMGAHCMWKMDAVTCKVAFKAPLKTVGLPWSLPLFILYNFDLFVHSNDYICLTEYFKAVFLRNLPAHTWHICLHFSEASSAYNNLWTRKSCQRCYTINKKKNLRFVYVLESFQGSSTYFIENLHLKREIRCTENTFSGSENEMNDL